MVVGRRLKGGGGETSLISRKCPSGICATLLNSCGKIMVECLILMTILTMSIDGVRKLRGGGGRARRLQTLTNKRGSNQTRQQASDSALCVGVGEGGVQQLELLLKNHN